MGICRWTEPKQMLHLMSSLRGQVLAEHRSFSEAERSSVKSCMNAFDRLYKEYSGNLWYE